MTNLHILPRTYIFPILLFVLVGCGTKSKKEETADTVPETTIVDRDYHLEATMLGYFAKDGTRNPTLRANKGDRVNITITNGETMTHDIAMEKLGIKSGTLLEKG